MPRRRSNAAPVLAPLAGAALLSALAVRAVPWKAVLDPPRTLLERGTGRSLSPGLEVVAAAIDAIPDGASYVVRTNPPDARLETWYHRFGVALLPGRRDRPAAAFCVFQPPGVWCDAEYVILVGARPAESPGELVLETPGGTVWRRKT